MRRIRARVEKEGLGDALATQILERKALDHILESVEIEDVPLDEPETAVETLDQTASPGGEPRAVEPSERRLARPAPSRNDGDARSLGSHREQPLSSRSSLPYRYCMNSAPLA